MNCKKVLLRLSAYQDGELSVLQAREVERHLESCAACRSEWETYKDLLVNLCRLTPLVPTPDFSFRIMTGLRARPEKKLRLLPSFAYTLALLMIFICGFLLEMSTNGLPASAPQTASTFSAVLAESQGLGLLAVHDSTLEMFGGDVHEK